jgi:hypothetical protein
LKRGAGAGRGDHRAGHGLVDVSAIPPRRLAELSRYGVDGKATLLKRHGDSRRLAALLATAVYLTSRAVDDALDLLDVLIATKLLARAERGTVKEKLLNEGVAGPPGQSARAYPPVSGHRAVRTCAHGSSMSARPSTATTLSSIPAPNQRRTASSSPSNCRTVSTCLA